jgi:hypothetical protein
MWELQSRSMNRLLMFLLLIAFTMSSAAQQTATPQPQPKTIKNPAEYNAYMSAVQQPNPQAKAQAFEVFIQQYPNSLVKEEALEHLLAAYAQAAYPVNVKSPAIAGPDPHAVAAVKMMHTANRLLDVNPDNLRALALVVSQKQALAKITSGPQEAALLRTEAADLAKRGLKAVANAQRPAGMSDDDYVKFISGVTTIFNGALVNGALAAPNNQATGQDLEALVRSKDWTATTIEISLGSVPDYRGFVQALAIVAGQRKLLLCTSSCPTLQKGTYNVEVKTGEIRILGTSMTSGKQYNGSFRISGTW